MEKVIFILGRLTMTIVLMLAAMLQRNGQFVAKRKSIIERLTNILKTHHQLKKFMTLTRKNFRIVEIQESPDAAPYYIIQQRSFPLYWWGLIGEGKLLEKSGFNRYKEFSTISFAEAAIKRLLLKQGFPTRRIIPIEKSQQINNN